MPPGSPRASLLKQIHQACHRKWARDAAGLGLSFSEFEYLSVVRDQANLLRYEDVHGQHLQDIVDALGVTKASASVMISKLEDRGLVSRFQCQMDARAQHIVLTTAGETLLSDGDRIYEQVAEQLKDVLTISAVT